MGYHHHSALQNDSLLRPGPAPWNYSMFRVPRVYAIDIVGKLVQNSGFVDIELFAFGKRTMC